MILLGWHDERVLRALVRHAKESGWHLETRHFFDETLPQGWTGDGMLVSNPSRPNLLRFMTAQAPKQPTVLIGRNHSVKLKVAAHIHEDNVMAGRLAAEHLLAMGHKHFVWWTSGKGSVPIDRLAGFRGTLALAGCDCTVLDYRAAGERSEWLRRRKWLRSKLGQLPRPAGLFAMDDQLAAEAVEMCQECGLKVPDDVAVVGVGNIALASETSPVAITSVDLDEEGIALEAARCLDRLMNGRRVTSAPVVIPPSGLVARESTAALALTDPVMIAAVHHIRERLAEPFDVAGLAAACGVSSRTLYHLFRSELRCTPADFLKRKQLERARILLESGETRIKELVASCGFGTARTMNRVFKSRMGCSPKEWRGRQSGEA
jgi:LacI family transcriptional regulator